MPIRHETRARVRALQLLYAWDAAGAPAEWGASAAAWGRVVQTVMARPAVSEGALTLAERVVRRHAELDALIVRAADRWRLERIGVVDRNVLRLGVLELVQGEVPPKVAIDEAVRLAQWFGGGKSPGFVNGILDRVARDLGRL
jgi:N utilization substance protein B